MLVYECTGFLQQKKKPAPTSLLAQKKVIISAPGKEVDATVVYGVNQDVLTSEMTGYFLMLLAQLTV